ncbi:MAG: alpha/beta fold hydrolase, partial [Chlamydiales bacterium]|nr:alpha/beta fold hydrolase [Chlamydiales bacterium]
MPTPSFTFLHGFLGCPQDWNTLTADFPHPFTSPSLEDIKVTEGSILVGYSMGGRIALSLAAEAPDKFAALILIGANPGIPDEQKPLRRAFEAQWLRVFRTL